MAGTLLPFHRTCITCYGEIATYGRSETLHAGVDFIRSHMGRAEWERRREAIAIKFYKSLIGQNEDPTGKGKFYDVKDEIAWQLFQGEAFNDHPRTMKLYLAVSDMYRYLKLFDSNLSFIKDISGIEKNVKDILGTSTEVSRMEDYLRYLPPQPTSAMASTFHFARRRAAVSHMTWMFRW